MVTSLATFMRLYMCDHIQTQYTQLHAVTPSFSLFYVYTNSNQPVCHALLTTLVFSIGVCNCLESQPVKT